jgi:hypothetical protein
MLYAVLGAVAQFERDLMRERTITGIQAAKNQGEHIRRPLALTPVQIREAKKLLKRGERARAGKISEGTRPPPSNLRNLMARDQLITRIEREIYEFEGFSVHIKPLNGKVPGRAPSYKYERRARDNFSVSDWKRSRFEPEYPELQVDVLLGDGRVATGKTRLERVRQSYD